MNWEYVVVRYRGALDEKLNAELDRLGSQAWELVLSTSYTRTMHRDSKLGNVTLPIPYEVLEHSLLFKARPLDRPERRR